MKNSKGFSLVELIGVIILISLATLIIVPNIVKVMDKNDRDTFEESVKGLIRVVQDNYASSLDNFPKDGLKISDITFDAKNLDKFTTGMIMNDNGTYTAVNVGDGKYCAFGKRNSLTIYDKACTNDVMGLIGLVDMDDFANWRTGMYSWDAGIYIPNYPSRICLKRYVFSTGRATYLYTASDSKYQLLIRELDKDHKYLGNNNLTSGSRYSPREETRYLGLTIYKPSNESITYAEYEELFNSGFKISLTKQ